MWCFDIIHNALWLQGDYIGSTMPYKGMYEVPYKGMYEVPYKGMYEVPYKGMYDVPVVRVLLETLSEKRLQTGTSPLHCPLDRQKRFRDPEAR